MSFDAYDEHTYLGQVATATGLYGFYEWIDTLDEADVPLLSDMTFDGVTETPHEAAKELANAIKSNPPASAGTLEVAKNVMKLLGMAKKDGVFIISAGLVEDDQEEGDGDEG
jgi:hypothetical protein